MNNLDLNKIVNRPVETAHTKYQEEKEKRQRTNDSNKALVYGFPQLAETVIVPTLNKISAELKKLGGFRTEMSVTPKAIKMEEVHSRPTDSFFGRDILLAWEGLSLEQIICRTSEMPVCRFSFTDTRNIPGRTVSGSGQVAFGLKRVKGSEVVKPYYDAWGVGRQHLNSLDEITETFITKICSAAIDAHVNPVERKREYTMGTQIIDGSDAFYD